MEKYVCLKCKTKWGMPNPIPQQCPKCGHIYVKWITWKNDLEKAKVE